MIFTLYFLPLLLISSLATVTDAQTTKPTTAATTASSNKDVTCVCDTGSTKSNNQGTCTITLNGDGDAVGYNGVCECQLPAPYYYQFAKSLGIYTVSCKAGTTTSPPSTTTTKATSKSPTTSPGETTVEPPVTDDVTGSGDDPTTAVVPVDEDEDEEILYMGACNTTAINGNKRKITKYLTWAASIWVILWTLITFIVNIVHR